MEQSTELPPFSDAKRSKKRAAAAVHEGEATDQQQLVSSSAYKSMPGCASAPDSLPGAADDQSPEQTQGRYRAMSLQAAAASHQHSYVLRLYLAWAYKHLHRGQQRRHHPLQPTKRVSKGACQTLLRLQAASRYRQMMQVLHASTAAYWAYLWLRHRFSGTGISRGAFTVIMMITESHQPAVWLAKHCR